MHQIVKSVTRKRVEFRESYLANFSPCTSAGCFAGLLLNSADRPHISLRIPAISINQFRNQIEEEYLHARLSSRSLRKIIPQCATESARLLGGSEYIRIVKSVTRKS
ncbi:hypothetical protein CEXT_34851 [Caerostris extrusa]|uniref:Uncharacterized protein n=1 Tax=Caerostris extrusa TaxID=172846 RepID=A0AAV4Y9W9_CAEEX|nr:hypothetical protein CEXT_34851 [Caerostris extrusa]